MHTKLGFKSTAPLNYCTTETSRRFKEYQKFSTFCEVLKLTMKENRKLKVTLKVADSVASKYLVTKNYIEENLMEEVTYFVWCLLAFEFFEEIHGSLFHVLPISLESRQMRYLDIYN